MVSETLRSSKTNDRFVRRQTFQSAKMLHDAPTAASTGRTAASGVIAGRQQWAVRVA